MTVITKAHQFLLFLDAISTQQAPQTETETRFDLGKPQDPTPILLVEPPLTNWSAPLNLQVNPESLIGNHSSLLEGNFFTTESDENFLTPEKLLEILLHPSHRLFAQACREIERRIETQINHSDKSPEEKNKLRMCVPYLMPNLFRETVTEWFHGRSNPAEQVTQALNHNFYSGFSSVFPPRAYPGLARVVTPSEMAIILYNDLPQLGGMAEALFILSSGQLDEIISPASFANIDPDANHFPVVSEELVRQINKNLLNTQEVTKILEILVQKFCQTPQAFDLAEEDERTRRAATFGFKMQFAKFETIFVTIFEFFKKQNDPAVEASIKQAIQPLAAESVTARHIVNFTIWMSQLIENEDFIAPQLAEAIAALPQLAAEKNIATLLALKSAIERGRLPDTISIHQLTADGVFNAPTATAAAAIVALSLPPAANVTATHDPFSESRFWDTLSEKLAPVIGDLDAMIKERASSYIDEDDYDDYDYDGDEE